MLFESSYDQLLFEIDNAGAPNTIYITDDETVNKLTLKITTNVSNTRFTPGQLVPYNEAPDVAGSILYLDVAALNLTAAEFNKLELVAAGWQFALYAPSTICFTPTKDITINNEPGQSIDIKINKLTIQQVPGSGNVTIDADYFRVPPISLFDGLPLQSYFSVVVQAAPDGSRNLHADMLCELVFEPYICNSIPGYDPVANGLTLLLNRRINGLVVNAGEDTVFTVSFVYAEAKPGYGALTTRQRAINEIKIQHGENASDWKITLDSNRENPGWYLRPAAAKPIVDATSSGVHFLIDNIITDFAPGPTVLTVEYKGIPGYSNGSFSIILMKVPHVSIPVFAAIPNPSYFNEHDKANVHVQWTAGDVGTLTLYPVPGDVTNKTHYDAEIATDTAFMLIAHGKQLATHGNVATKTTNVTVLPRINSFAAIPANTYYRNFPAGISLAWIVDTPGEIKLVSSIPGIEPRSFSNVGSVKIDITKPQMITLEPEGVKNPLYMRSVLLNAFQFRMRTENLQGMSITEIVCMPDGRILFGISPGQRFVCVLDAFTMKPAQPSVPLKENPIAMVLSPDGSLLYVACELLVVSVFKIKSAGNANISIEHFTDIEVGATITAIALSPAGDQLYIAGMTPRPVFIAYAKDEDNRFTEVAVVEISAPPFKMAVTPSGEYIFIGGAVTLCVYTIRREFGTKFTYTGMTILGYDFPQAMAVTTDSELLIICTKRAYLYIMSVKSRTIGYIRDVVEGTQNIAMSRSGDYICASGWNGVSVISYNKNNAAYFRVLENIPVPGNGENTGVCISRSERQVFIAGVSTINSLSMVAYERGKTITGFKMRATDAVASPDGSEILFWENLLKNPTDPTPGILVLDTSNYNFSMKLVEFMICDLVYSPNNKFIYVIQRQDTGTTVNMKSAADYSDKGQIRGFSGVPWQIFITPDGALLFVTQMHPDGSNSIAIADVSKMAVIKIINLRASVFAINLPLSSTPDMQKIFVAQNEVVSIIENGPDGYTLISKTITAGSPLSSLRMLPDGSKLIGISEVDRVISVIDLKKYTVQNIILPGDFAGVIHCVTVSPDSSNIVLSTDKSTILFIDTATYTSIYAVATHEGAGGIVYSNDGAQVFVGCLNGVEVAKQIQPE